MIDRLKYLSLLICCTCMNAVWAGADTGFYLGASLGSAELEVTAQNLDFDDEDSAYKAIAGYNFGWVPFIDLGVEAAYIDFGEVSQTLAGNTARVGVTGLSASGLAGLKMGPLGLFAKVGLFSWDAEIKGVGTQSDDSGSDGAYGIGIRAQLLSAAVRLEYELFEIDNVDISLLSAGAVWTF